MNEVEMNQLPTKNRLFRSALLLAGALWLGVAGTQRADAAEVQIADGDTAALLAAFEAAGQSGEFTVIRLAASGHYELPATAEEVILAGNVVLDGNGGTVTATRDGFMRTTFTVAADASYRISDLAWNGVFVGPWMVNTGALSMENVTFSGQFVPGFLTLAEPTGPPRLIMTGSLIRSQGVGRSLVMRNGTIDLSVLADPILQSFVYLVYAPSGTASLNHVTMRVDQEFPDDIYGVSVIGIGAGYDQEENAQVEVSNSIIMIRATGIDGTSARGTACFAFEGSTIQSLGGNIASDPNCGFERTVMDAGFGSFGEHGGLVPTLALQAVSPAVNFGASEYCLRTDARGYLRGTQCDSGAFEFGAALPGGGLLDMGAAGYWNPVGAPGFIAVSFPSAGTPLLVWSTFDASGNPATVYGVGEFADADTIVVSQAAIDLPVPGSNPVRIQPVTWGELRFDLASCTAARLHYQTSQPGFTSGEKSLDRLTVLSSVGCSELAH